LIPAEEGSFTANFPDMPNGWSQSETRDEAEDMLDGDDPRENGA
jgi:predicted RNase H-like HicB family nuclease